MCAAASIDVLGAVGEDVGKIEKHLGPCGPDLATAFQGRLVAATSLQQQLGDIRKLGRLVDIILFGHQGRVFIGSVLLPVKVDDNSAELLGVSNGLILAACQACSLRAVRAVPTGEVPP